MTAMAISSTSEIRFRCALVRMVTVTLVLAAAVVAWGPSPADAANRWASPTGSGSWPCVQSSPCPLATASGDSELQDGDHIVLAGGNYEVGSGITITKRVTLRPAPGTGQPAINGIGPGGTQALVNMASSGVRIDGVRFHISGASGWALRVDDAHLDGVYAFASANSTAGVVATGNTYIRSSIIYATGSSSSGLNTGEGHTRVVNSTVIASSASSIGVMSNTCYSGPGQTQWVSLANSYIRGGAYDIALFNSCSGVGKTIDVTTRYSSYDPANVNVDPDPNMTFTPGPGIVNRISRPAQFVNEASGNFRQLSGSPTINRGSSSTGAAGSLGDTDYFGVTRLQGGRPDIGASERPTRPKLKAKGKSVSAGKKIKLKVRCDEACRVSISGGVKSKTLKNLKANKWKSVTLRVKNPAAAKVKVKMKARDTDGQTRRKTIKVKL